MPIVGTVEPSRDLGRDRRGDGLEDDREAPASSSASASCDELCCGLGRLALRLEPAELRRRLGRQADVAHDGDARVDDRLHARDHRAGALELDRVGARLLDEADRVLERLLVGDLERAERHVADDDRMPWPTRATVRVRNSISSIVTGTVVPS